MEEICAGLSGMSESRVADAVSESCEMNRQIENSHGRNGGVHGARYASISTLLHTAKTKSHVIAGMCLLLLAATATTFAQDMPSSTGLQDTAPGSVFSRSATTDNDPSNNGLNQSSRPAQRDTVETEAGSSTVLSTNQIIVLLHQKPEVIVDLKQVMSDFFLKHGIAIQADSITDEILFSNIASNAELRQTISVWLRARGYASDADFAQSTDTSLDSDSLLNPDSSLDPDRLETSSRAQDRDSEYGTSDGMSQLALALRDLPADSELLPQDTSNPALNELLKSGADKSRLEPTEARKTTDTTKRTTSQRPPAKKEIEPATGDKIDVIHQPAPYNLQSLRDLYTQVPEQTAKITRFGSNVFLSRGEATKTMPIDLPIGPDYILGPGDSITISLWGGVSQSFTRIVDREGKLILPEAGAVVVAGLTLERAQALIQGLLNQQFKDAHVAVSVAHLRTVRVYVVGDVQRPGAYDISSLSTPLNALYAAGGPTSVGSLRTVRHYRGKTLIREVDLYDFLLHGIRADVERLEPGDTIQVPAAGPQVEVSGMVKRPAIYELKGETKLSDLFDDAGGIRVSAALPHIRIERIEPDGHRATLHLDLPEGSTIESAKKQMDSFAVKDGDRVIVAPILPYSEKAIYVAGHAVRPGKVPYRDGMKLSDVIRSYQDLLPEPADHGEIIRLMPPDLHPEAIAFNLTEVLAGSTPIYLQPFDTIRIRGRYEVDEPKVTVRGEVLRPGAYALAEGMTAAQLVRIAGGFKRSALLDSADLASYEVRDAQQVVSLRSTVAIGKAVIGLDAKADVPLKSGDVLTVHQISGWSDIGASVTLTGEVNYPGTYGLQEGERLSSVIRRAGGFRITAYPDGAVLVRKQVKELEDKSRAELIRQIETTSVGARLGTSVTGNSEDSGTLQLLIQQQNQVLQRLRSQRSIGRLVIKVSRDLASWENTSADIELRSGDVLTVPKRPSFVLVSGQAYNASAITYVPGKDAGWYLRRAGGATDLANRKEIFVIRANGLVVGRRSGEWYQEKVLSTKLEPGDVVVVPQKIVGGSVFWKNTLAIAQVASSIGLTAAFLH
jgi:protein involved in polysaccharide export with SLBB domain